MTIKSLLDKLGVNETLTKPPKKQKVFNKIKDNIPLVAHYNYMADLLQLPEISKKNKYCLVVVDIATNKFDLEPLNTKNQKQPWML